MLYKIRNLKKVYGERTVLDLDLLDIDSGKVYTLIGPNGAGKTTLLNILSFLDAPTQGKVSFKGKSVPYAQNNLHKQRQKVVLVDQYPILFTGPVWKNIEYGLKVRKIDRGKRQEIVRDVLDMVGMSDFIDADAHKLSGGETKRVALARALAIEPEVLLCDEPTANVDTENQEIILKILERCNSQKKVSLIFATHYLSQAQRLADHTIVLQNGRLSSSRGENIFPAILTEKKNNSVTWLVGGCQTLATEEVDCELTSSHRIFIDPKRIRIIGSDTPPADDNIWRGTITQITKVNHSVMVTLDCGFDLNVMLSIKDYTHRPLAIDQKVACSIPTDVDVMPKS